MSQAARPTQTHSISADRALDFFESAIWHNAEICTACFARLTDSFSGEFETHSGRMIEVDDIWRTPDATLGEAHEEPPESVASVYPLARPRTTCLNCGSVGGEPKSDTLSRREALKRVPALVERLREQGLEVHERTVREGVRHLKSSQTHTHDDKHVFAGAAAYGVGL